MLIINVSDWIQYFRQETYMCMSVKKPLKFRQMLDVEPIISKIQCAQCKKKGSLWPSRGFDIAASISNSRAMVITHTSFTPAASHWLHCRLPQEMAELVFVFCDGGVQAFCRHKVERIRPKISWDLRLFMHKALPREHNLHVLWFNEKALAI